MHTAGADKLALAGGSGAGTLALQAPPAETPAAKGAAIGRGLYRLGSAACRNASMYYGAAEGTPGGIAGDT